MVTSRIWFTAQQKAELWERWRNGLSVAAISRVLDRRNKTGVLRIVTLHGGITPAPRQRAVAALRFARGAKTRVAMVTGADLRLAEAGVPDRPRHANIS